MSAAIGGIAEYKNQPEWEVADRHAATYRIQVPGGWLYKSGGQFDKTGAMVFVPEQPKSE